MIYLCYGDALFMTEYILMRTDLRTKCVDPLHKTEIEIGNVNMFKAPVFITDRSKAVFLS